MALSPEIERKVAKIDHDVSHCYIGCHLAS